MPIKHPIVWRFPMGVSPDIIQLLPAFPGNKPSSYNLVAPFQETPLYGPKDVSKHPLLNHVCSAGFEVGDDCWCFGWPEAPPQTAGSVERQTSDWKKGFNMVQYIWLHMVNHVFRMKNYGILFWSVHVPSSIRHCINWKHMHNTKAGDKHNHFLQMHLVRDMKVACI